MSTPTARDLLAQADRLMRQRTPEELPVLTDLVIEEIDIPSLSDRMDDVIPTHARPAWMPALPAASPQARSSPPPDGVASLRAFTAPSPSPVLSPSTPAHAAVRPAPTASSVPVAQPLERSPPESALFAANSRAQQAAYQALATSEGPNTQTAMASVREKFNEQLLAKMEELHHSVFSQVMQKLEVHAAGSLKTQLRETLEPALLGIARELAEQVAEDTASRVRQVVSDAVDAEIARLREQFAKKRF